MSQSVAENIKTATQATIDALNAWDYEALIAVRADNFVFQGLPGSLNLPAMNNDDYGGLWNNVMTPAFQDFKVSHISKNKTCDDETDPCS